MNILDAFDPSVISELSDALDDEAEQDIVMWSDSYATDYYKSARDNRSDDDWSPAEVSVEIRQSTAMMAFMAGMAYQQGTETTQIPIMMNRSTLAQFIEFLASQAASV